MLIVETQPDVLCPIPKGRPVQWVIRNTDYVVSEGSNATITITFSAGGGANGQVITLAGVDFTSDDSVAYTDTTFDFSVDLQSSANNLANAVRSNYLFLAWSVEVEEVSGQYVVTVTNSNEEELDNFVNDASALVPAVALADTNGTFRVVSNARLWYELWQGGQAVGQMERVDFDSNGRAVINVRETADALLGAITPYLLWSTPRQDERAAQRVYLRFGSYEVSGNCDPVFGRTYETATVELVNAVFPHEDLFQFRPHCSRVTLPVKWMTSRSSTRITCRGSFEWAALYMMTSVIFPSMDVRYEYRYYDDLDVLIASKNVLQLNRLGVVRVPIGPRFDLHPAGAIDAASYYTIDVVARNADDEYVAYAEQMRVNLKNCACKGLELYYLEYKGSWRTLIFDRIDSRRVSVESNTVVRQLAYSDKGGAPDGISLFVEGGRSDVVDSVDAPFVLVSEKITSHNRKDYEEFLQSPTHYILSASSLLPAIRRITIERATWVTEQSGEVPRLEVICRLNTEKRHL